MKVFHHDDVAVAATVVAVAATAVAAAVAVTVVAAGDVVVVVGVDICHQVQLNMADVLSSSSVHEVDLPSLPSPNLQMLHTKEGGCSLIKGIHM